jgi:tetratricopeptide (TPR) repeat protein
MREPVDPGERQKKESAPWAARWILAAVALSAGVVFWSRPEPAPLVPTARAPDASAKTPRRRPKTALELRTTSADIWLENLDGTIAELERLVRARPEILQNTRKLAAARHLRGRFRGDLDEIASGIDALTSCIESDPDDAECVLMRAEQEQSLHRFAQARADLALAKSRGADPTRIEDLEAELDWNDGRYDRAIARIRSARRERPSTATWIREAQLDYELGADAEGETAFERAEDAVTDTSPFIVAHLNVQRGIQLALRGKLDEACVFFREAVERLPTYVAAKEHLAEALQKLGRDDEATTIYEEVVRLSDDPEFLHALAALYAKRGRPGDARNLEAKARTRYDELLEKYPEAMYWHASEFFMSTGEKKTALELLRKNVGLRPNSASLVALARAELENDLVADARVYIDKALTMPVLSAELFWTASLVHRRAGDGARADALRGRAKTLNPRLEADDL